MTNFQVYSSNKETGPETLSVPIVLLTTGFWQRLIARDVAKGLKYYPGCLIAMYNQGRAHLNSQEIEKND